MYLPLYNFSLLLFTQLLCCYAYEGYPESISPIVNAENTLITWGRFHIPSVSKDLNSGVKTMQGFNDRFYAITEEGKLLSFGGSGSKTGFFQIAHQVKTGVKSIHTIDKLFLPNEIEPMACIKENGMLVTWGLSYRQPILSGNVVDVAVLRSGYAVVTDDGSLTIWGEVGQLPKVVSYEGTYKQVFGYESAVAVLDETNSVSCMGNPEKGGLCDSISDELKNVKDVFVGYNGFGALTLEKKFIYWTNGTAEAMEQTIRRVSNVDKVFVSQNGFALLDTTTNDLKLIGHTLFYPEITITDVLDVIPSERGCLVLLTNGTVQQFGYLEFSNLELLNDIVSIEGSGHQFAATTSTGKVILVSDWDASLTYEDVEDQLNSNVASIHFAAAAALVIKEDKEVVTWGDVHYGAYIPNHAREAIRTNNIKEIVTNTGAFAILFESGKVVTFGAPEYGGHASEPRFDVRYGVKKFDVTSNSQGSALIFSSGVAELRQSAFLPFEDNYPVYPQFEEDIVDVAISYDIWLGMKPNGIEFFGSLYMERANLLDYARSITSSLSAPKSIEGGRYFNAILLENSTAVIFSNSWSEPTAYHIFKHDDVKEVHTNTNILVRFMDDSASLYYSLDSEYVQVRTAQTAILEQPATVKKVVTAREVFGAILQDGDGLGFHRDGGLRLESTVENPFVDVFAHKRSIVFLKQDGSLVCYNGASGKCPKLSGVSSIRSGREFFTAKTNNGEGHLWGIVENKRIDQTFSNVKQFAVEQSSAVVLKQDGTISGVGDKVVKWIRDAYDDLTNIVEVFASKYGYVGRKGDGLWVAWGTDTFTRDFAFVSAAIKGKNVIGIPVGRGIAFHIAGMDQMTLEDIAYDNAPPPPKPTSSPTFNPTPSPTPPPRPTPSPTSPIPTTRPTLYVPTKKPTNGSESNVGLIVGLSTAGGLVVLSAISYFVWQHQTKSQDVNLISKEESGAIEVSVK